MSDIDLTKSEADLLADSVSELTTNSHTSVMEVEEADASGQPNKKASDGYNPVTPPTAIVTPDPTPSGSKPTTSEAGTKCKLNNVRNYRWMKAI